MRMLYTTFDLTGVTRNKEISCDHNAGGGIIVIQYCMPF